MTRTTDPHTAIAQLPSGRFLMAAAYDEIRAGTIVYSVQSCGHEFPLLCVAVRTGHPIEPIIRDSRCFALSWLEESCKLVSRKFDRDAEEDLGDPFDAIAVETLETDSPVLCSSPLVFDCEVLRHFDLEADHELYIGQVVACRAVLRS